jgi:hypothetical protein
MALIFGTKPAHRVTDGVLVVEVFCGETSGRSSGPPVYSVRVGKEVTRKKEDGSLEAFVAPHIRVYQDRGCMTEARIESPFAAKLSALLHDAEDWIQRDMSLRYEAYLEERREWEQDEAGRGRPKTRRTGKTERDREKRRNRQQNRS